MAAEANLCASCGAPIVGAAPEGLCPQCLLQGGLDLMLSDSSTLLDQTATDRQAPVAPNRPGPRPGERFGDYELIRILGQGGMGTVFEADHLPSQRRVALKVLNDELDSPEARERFLREGQLAASINHPNSVYIFGTEEIEGVPVISMELVPGGTLKDMVKKRGPLPVTEAVDIILQVIAGLEAAQATGILHRDIKPANCFVDLDGTVKIGDFGLSISTLARDGSDPTKRAFMGTPAFASPEQIRGEALDVRSDIYSVGATLFYLISGRPPFEGATIEQLLNSVLRAEWRLPDPIRSHVPRSFTKVLAHCLAKANVERIPSYDVLRGELSIFSSSVVSAPIGQRLLAGLCDLVLVFGFLFLLGRYFPVFSITPYGWLTFFTWIAAFYGVFESLVERSPGKALFGLRIVGLDGERLPTSRTLLRIVLFAFFLASPWLTFSLLWSPGRGMPGWMILYIAFCWVPSHAVGFVTARRRNGHAAIHDLLAKARVMKRSERLKRPSSLPETPDLGSPVKVFKLGPYEIMGSHSEVLVGLDPVLRRNIWIRLGEFPSGANRREVARPGRLRWLNGGATADGPWNAFEAPSGRALLQWVCHPQPWGTVRYWLADLAEELNASSKDQSRPPVLALDRIWITSDGRAKILEFPAPGISSATPTDGRIISPVPPEPSPNALGQEDAHIFLNQVARSALEGHPIAIDQPEIRTAAAVPLPLEARAVLQTLPCAKVSDEVVRSLKELLLKPAALSRWRRSGVVIACGLMILGSSWREASRLTANERSTEACRDLESLRQSLKYYYRLSLGREPLPSGNPLLFVPRRIEESDVHFRIGKSPTASGAEELAAMETYIAGRYRHLISKSDVWRSGFADSFLGQEFRYVADKISKVHAGVSAEDLDRAQQRLGSSLQGDVSQSQQRIWDNSSRRSIKMWLLPWLLENASFKLAVQSLIFTPLLAGGILIRLFGIAFVAADGSPPGLGRIFMRTLLAWSPILMIHNIRHADVANWIAPLMVVLMVFGIVWAVFRPQRGLADFFAGTWLVPR